MHIPRPMEMPPPDVVAEFDWLMSLALDDLLDEADDQRFHELLDAHPVLAQSWAQWRLVDQQLAAAPYMAPAPGFVDRFETRLAAREQRAQRWMIATLAVAVLLASGMVVLGTAGLGAFVFLTQGSWIGQQIHGVAYAYSAASAWLDSLTATADAVTNTPQVQTLGLVYMAAVAVMIYGWLMLLRRRSRLDQAMSPIQVE